MNKLSLFFVCAICLSSCAGVKKSGNVTINVYNWGEYIDQSVLTGFTDKTGVHVNYDTYPSNEDLYAKLKSGGVNYDVAVPSDYMVQRMIREGMLEKLDRNNIPNLKYIDKRFTNVAYDPAGEYSVPYMWGTVGILYNKKMVSDPVDSWNILWDQKYKGKIFMYDSMRDTLSVALRRLGFSLNTTDIGQLESAGQSLIQQKPLVQAYVGDTVRDSMIGNEAALAVVYSGDALYCMDNNPDLGYVIPKEGSNVWIDAVVIPKGSAHRAEAEQFIDYLCQPEVCLKNVEYIGYSTVNSETFKMLPDDMKNNPTFWPPDDAYNRCEIFSDLGDFTKEYDRVWTEVLAASN